MKLQFATVRYFFGNYLKKQRFIPQSVLSVSKNTFVKIFTIHFQRFKLN